jgi:hypothetical protein
MVLCTFGFTAVNKLQLLCYIEPLCLCFKAAEPRNNCRNTLDENNYWCRAP